MRSGGILKFVNIVNDICVKICEMPLVLFFTGSLDKVQNNLILGIILTFKQFTCTLKKSSCKKYSLF